MKVVQLATTLRPTERCNGAYISIDDETREALGGGGRIPVRATFNGAEYRGTICKMGGASALESIEMSERPPGQSRRSCERDPRTRRRGADHRSAEQATDGS